VAGRSLGGEYWNPAADRWQMADAQLDETWRAMISFTGDPLAITSSEFVTGGHAWQASRRGDLDAGRCGLSTIDDEDLVLSALVADEDQLGIERRWLRLPERHSGGRVVVLPSDVTRIDRVGLHSVSIAARTIQRHVLQRKDALRNGRRAL
jgi:hypothetical protein